MRNLKYDERWEDQDLLYAVMHQIWKHALILALTVQSVRYLHEFMCWCVMAELMWHGRRNAEP